MPLSDADIDKAVERYERERDRFQKLVDFVHLECVTLVRENARFSGPDGAPVTDVRDFGDSYYRGTHCLATLTDEDLVAGYENLRDIRCEIQVCSLLAHVWNEIEHDRAYKPASGQLNEQEQSALESLGNLTRAGDNIIETLLTATDARLAEEQGVFRDQWDFVARARQLFPDASNFRTNSGQLHVELMSAGIDTPERLRELVGADGPARASELLDRLQAHLDEIGDEIVGQVDPESSDCLLMLLLENQANEVLERHPAGPGHGRPPRITSVARRYLEMVDATGSGNTPEESG